MPKKATAKTRSPSSAPMSPPERSGVVVAVFAAAVLFAADDAAACAACGCGSQAPLPLGSELPFAGRFRTALTSTSTATARTDALGTAELLVAQAALSVAWSVDEHWVLDASLPFSGRLLRHDGVVEATGAGAGDVDVGVRYALRSGALSGGLRLGGQAPTTTVIRDDVGAAINGAVQPGAAAWGVSGQGHVALEQGPLLGVVTLAGALPLSTALSWQTPPSALTRAVGYLRASPRVSAVVGVSAVVVGDTVSAGVNLKDARVSAGPEAGVVLEPAMDWALTLSAWVPAAMAPLSSTSTSSKERVSEGARVSLSLAKDW